MRKPSRYSNHTSRINIFARNNDKFKWQDLYIGTRSFSFSVLSTSITFSLSITYNKRFYIAPLSSWVFSFSYPIRDYNLSLFKPEINRRPKKNILRYISQEIIVWGLTLTLILSSAYLAISLELHCPISFTDLIFFIFIFDLQIICFVFIKS